MAQKENILKNKKTKILYQKNIRRMMTFFVPVIVGRIFILIFSPELYYSSIMDVFYIIRGIVSDLLPTAIFGYVVSFIPSKKIIWGLWLLTCFISASNAEHIIVNLGNIDFRYTLLAASTDFFSGSVFSLRVNLLVFSNIFISFSIIKMIKRWKKYNSANASELTGFLQILKKTTPYLSFLLLGLLVLPMNYAVFPCVQMGIVEENIKKTYYNLYVEWFHKKQNLTDDIRNKLFGKDLNAPLLIPRAFDKPNILLVLLESIGHGTLESGMMPNMEKYAAENIYYPRYMISQKQTNRGLYNVLCGDYPNLVHYKAKPDLIEQHGKKCLPVVLSNNKYSTIFMQSSPLDFMNKKDNMPKAGFKKVTGSESYTNVLGRTAWGVDDRTLYYAALDEIKKTNDPWFMTLLTVGTHHPYRPKEGEKSSYETAVRYADKAIKEFLDNLEKEGKLNNTLVIITSDESHGPLNNGTIPLIARNHSFVIMKPPGKPVKKIEEDLFAASDMMISIADYLGLQTEKMIGRSFFRDYNREDRNLVFGNTYAGVFYYLYGNNLNVCNYDYDCSHYTLKGKFLEDYTFKKEGVKKIPEIMQAIVQYNDWKK
jgi:hypothetical protein